MIWKEVSMAWSISPFSWRDYEKSQRHSVKWLVSQLIFKPRNSKVQVKSVTHVATSSDPSTEVTLKISDFNGSEDSHSTQNSVTSQTTMTYSFNTTKASNNITQWLKVWPSTVHHYQITCHTAASFSRACCMEFQNLSKLMIRGMKPSQLCRENDTMLVCKQHSSVPNSNFSPKTELLSFFMGFLNPST